MYRNERGKGRKGRDSNLSIIWDYECRMSYFMSGLQSAKIASDQNSLGVLLITISRPSVTRVTLFVGNWSKHSVRFDEVKVVLLNKRRSHHNKVTNDLANNASACWDENDCLEFLHHKGLFTTSPLKPTVSKGFKPLKLFSIRTLGRIFSWVGGSNAEVA